MNKLNIIIIKLLKLKKKYQITGLQPWSNYLDTCLFFFLQKYKCHFSHNYIVSLRNYKRVIYKELTLERFCFFFWALWVSILSIFVLSSEQWKQAGHHSFQTERMAARYIAWGLLKSLFNVKASPVWIRRSYS